MKVNWTLVLLNRVTQHEKRSSTEKTRNGKKKSQVKSYKILWKIIWFYQLKVKCDHRSKFSNLSNWKEAWKKSGLQRDSNPWPPRYRCDALPTELWSHTLGARSIYWVHFFPCSEIMWSNISKTSASVSSGFQTRENWWKHEAAGRVLLLFSSVWNPDETRSTSFWNYFSNKRKLV